MNIIINQRVTERCRPGESVRCILALHHKHHHRTRTDARLDLGYQYLAQDDMMMFTVLARENDSHAMREAERGGKIEIVREMCFHHHGPERTSRHLDQLNQLHDDFFCASERAREPRGFLGAPSTRPVLRGPQSLCTKSCTCSVTAFSSQT